MPSTLTPNSWLEVDLAAVEHNARALRRAPPGAVLCGVVKKDAYGLGGAAVGRALEAAGAGMLAVYEPREAVEIAEAGVGLPFLVLNGTLVGGDAWEGLAEAGRLEFQVGDGDLLEVLDAEGRRRGVRVPVHLHVDTGMSREGMPGPAFVDAVRAVPERAGLRLAGVMTHLATADSDPERAAGQVAAFDALLAQVTLPEDAVVHVCNSYGTLREPAWHRRMIRPGIGLYGYAEPTLDAGTGGWEAGVELKPVARWVSRISRVLDAKAGSPVGYGATEFLGKDTRLGLVPVGYADGYPLALSGLGVVRVGGAACRVVGRVSMDQVMVDLSGVPGSRPGGRGGGLRERSRGIERPPADGGGRRQPRVRAAHADPPAGGAADSSGASGHGLKASTPAASKSARFLVTTARPWRAAVAAMRPSTTGICTPRLRAAAFRSCQSSAVSASTAKMRSACSDRSCWVHAASSLRRRPCGSRRIPPCSSATVNTLRWMSNSGCSASQRWTTGAGVGRWISENTHVSTSQVKARSRVAATCRG